MVASLKEGSISFESIPKGTKHSPQLLLASFNLQHVELPSRCDLDSVDFQGKKAFPIARLSLSGWNKLKDVNLGALTSDQFFDQEKRYVAIQVPAMLCIVVCTCLCDALILAATAKVLLQPCVRCFTSKGFARNVTASAR